MNILYIYIYCFMMYIYIYIYVYIYMYNLSLSLYVYIHEASLGKLSRSELCDGFVKYSALRQAVTGLVTDLLTQRLLTGAWVK